MSDESGVTMVLDPTVCVGRGMCHEAAPDLIDLDEWGYPILRGSMLRAHVAPPDVLSARAATHACPVLALHLERERARPSGGAAPSARH